MKTHVRSVSKLTDSEQESCTSIFRGVMRLRQILYNTAASVAKSHGLHGSEMALLDTLGKYGPVQMGELADRSFSSPANATYTARSLEKQGLLIRERSTASQRVVNVRLTRDGEKMFKRTFPQMISRVNQLLDAKLSRTERKTLDGLLTKLTD